MSNERFQSARFEFDGDVSYVDLSGFSSNPLGETLTSAQVQLYQAAFLQARKALAEPEWPWAENWN